MTPVKHLYVHIPFCNNLCKYCDFVRLINQPNDIKKKYIKKVTNQIQKKYKLKQFQTIYVGGGTPNCLDDQLLSELLSTLNKYIDKRANYEFTIECNPELVNVSQVNILKKCDINRISLGAQTVNNDLLKQMNRRHT
jgi:oxygen-independent coproporphyrinogen-3 oxidase